MPVRAHKITFMIRKTAPMAAVLALAMLSISCSDAPVVPARSTNRRVLAELISEVG